MDSLKEIVKNLPSAPGVYRFLDPKGEVLYVGKAIDLKKRVSSYFRSSQDQSMRLQKLVEKITDIQFTIVDSELEALILETNLIKSYRPRYNILMKDDKNYVYLKIAVNEEYPRIFITRKVEKDGARYFGPKTSASQLKQTLNLLKKIFPYRHCGLTISFEGKEPNPLRTGKPGEGGGPFKVLVGNKVIKYPCIDYHIKRCVGPCVGTVTPGDYRKTIDQVIDFFEGKTETILRELREEIQDAAAAKQFERAALLRDRMLGIERLMETQRVSSPDSIQKDVIGLSIEAGAAYATLFMFREGKLLSQENFVLNAVDVESGAELEEGEVLSAFLQQYYERAADLPREILIPKPIENQAVLEDWLYSMSGHRIKILVPSRGKSRKILDLAHDNAMSFAKQSQLRWQSDRGENIENALENLKSQLNLSKLPKRIECYDISHLGGEDTVGSMVVFENGIAKKADYRHFKLRSVQERIDDYQAMHEVLKRRLRYLQPPSTAIRKPLKREMEYIRKNLEKEKYPSETVEVKRVLVYELKKKVVGILQWEEVDKDVKVIVALWVDEKHRGTGIGKALIFGFLGKQKKGKVYVLSCEARVDWYGAMGFHEVPEMPDALKTYAEDRQKRQDYWPMSLVYRIQKTPEDTSFLRKPDLLVIDGGKGQLSTAVQALKETELKIPVIGLAKKEEWIFFPEQSDPLILSHESSELQLLQRLRDEAHRFALKYQRNLRGKRMVS